VLLVLCPALMVTVPPVPPVVALDVPALRTSSPPVALFPVPTVT
jgi:hypothetical protein